jgi:hypothetical protein
METPSAVGPMLREMAVYGGAMALTITAVWAVIVLIVSLRAKAAPELRVKESPVAGGS